MAVSEAQERLWATQRAEALTRFIEDEAHRIVRLRSLQARRDALAKWQYGKPAKIRERLDERVKAIWDVRQN